jgi:hypothetical protein
MKKIIVMVAISMTMFANMAQADLSLNAFKQLSAGGQLDKTSAEMYVGGVIKGYLNANAYLGSTRQPQMFCFNGDINTGNALQLASQAVDEHLAKKPGDGKEEIVELLLLMKLKSLYPC